MNNFLVNIFLNHSIVLPAVLGAVRFKKIVSSFIPFIILIWLGLLNETLSLALIFSNGSNALNSNIYVLLEYGIILWQFYEWNQDGKKKYYFFALAGVAVWILDNGVLNSPMDNNSIFRVFYSIVLVFFSIDQVNKILIYEKGRLIKNAMFLICVTFLVYYGCKAFIEVFNAFRLGLSDHFFRHLWMILYFVNVFANIMYAIAIVCLPTKQEFILPY